MVGAAVGVQLGEPDFSFRGLVGGVAEVRGEREVRGVQEEHVVRGAVRQFGEVEEELLDSVIHVVKGEVDGLSRRALRQPGETGQRLSSDAPVLWRGWGARGPVSAAGCQWEQEGEECGNRGLRRPSGVRHGSSFGSSWGEQGSLRVSGVERSRQERTIVSSLPPENRDSGGEMRFSCLKNSGMITNRKNSGNPGQGSRG